MRKTLLALVLVYYAASMFTQHAASIAALSFLGGGGGAHHGTSTVGEGVLEIADPRRQKDNASKAQTNARSEDQTKALLLAIAGSLCGSSQLTQSASSR